MKMPVKISAELLSVFLSGGWILLMYIRLLSGLTITEDGFFIARASLVFSALIFLTNSIVLVIRKANVYFMGFISLPVIYSMYVLVRWLF